MSRSYLTRRNFIAGLGLGVAGIALAACGGAAPAAPTAAPAAPAAAPTTAPAAPAAAAPAAAAPTTAPAAAAPSTNGSGTVNWLVRANPEENKGQANVFEPDLKKQLPDLTINRIVVPQAEYIVKINTMAAANNPLEIFGFGQNYYDFWYRNLTQNLDSYVSGDKWDVKSYFLPGLTDIYTIHGHLYGLPQLTCYGCVLSYNKDMFDAAGLAHPPMDYNDKTWNLDKFLEVATKLTKNYGAPDATYGANVILGQTMNGLAYLFGGDSWVPEHYTNFIAQKTNFNSPEVIAGHQWRQDLIYKNKVHPDPSALAGSAQGVNPFKTGKIGMWVDGGWTYWTNSDITEFKVGNAAIPWGPTNKNTIYDDFWEMGRWGQNKDGAWKVMRVLTSVDTVNRYSVYSGTPPTPRESTAPWAAKVAERIGEPVDKFMKLLSTSIEKGRVQESPDHLFLQYPKISTTYDNEIAALWNHADATAAQVIPAMAKTMDQTVLDIYTQFKDSMPKD